MPPSDPQLSSDETFDVGSPNTTDHDAAALTVRPEELPATRPALKSVVRNWLQDRYDLTVVAGCTNAVKGLIFCMRGLELANKRPLFRPLELVSVCICMEAFKVALFILKFQNRLLHRYLLRLESDEAIKKLGNKLPGRIGVGVGLFEQILDIQSDLSRTFSEADSAFRAAKEARDGL